MIMGIMQLVKFGEQKILYYQQEFVILLVLVVGEVMRINVVLVIIVVISYQVQLALQIVSQVMEIPLLDKFVFFVIMYVKFVSKNLIIAQLVLLLEPIKHIYWPIIFLVRLIALSDIFKIILPKLVTYVIHLV